PIYMTLGNVPKKFRYKKDHRAHRVLGYFPVFDISSHYKSKNGFLECKMAIYHHCLKTILAPFYTQSTIPSVLFFRGPFGLTYKCQPLLATYGADYPKQCLLAAVK
ncbi:hypothetical protein BC941DRAFT_319739, partial [Chlamydoabsidia padenii]